MLAGAVVLIVLVCQLHVVTVMDGNGLRIPDWRVLDTGEFFHLEQLVSVKNCFIDMSLFLSPCYLKGSEACHSHLLHLVIV